MVNLESGLTNKRKFTKRFRGLRTRLTLTYTLVTVGALLALLMLLLILMMALLATTNVDETSYLSDVQVVLGFRVGDYLAEGDLDGLQSWMNRRYESGLASDEPFDIFDSPEAPFSAGTDFFVLDNDGIVIAQAPHQNLIGQEMPLPANANKTWFDMRRNTVIDPFLHHQALSDGNWFVVFPVHSVENRFGGDPNGSIALTIEPPPPFFRSYLAVFGLVVGIAAIALVIGVAPFGAIFGYLMARNLTRRLTRLETAAEAWSLGDFHVMPQENSEDEIGRLAARLRKMAQEIATLLHNRQELAAVEERNRLARELHDTVKQQNFATMMQVRAAKNLAQPQKDTAAALAHLESAESLLKQSQEDLKTVIDNLRPIQLEGHGLPIALRQYVESWTAQNNIETTIEIEGERQLSLSNEQALYRIAQEALSNVARHSTANLVTIQLNFTEPVVSLMIADNGQGFDSEATQSGFGLSTMRQRLTEAGGRLIIDSSKGQGTRITAVIP